MDDDFLGRGWSFPVTTDGADDVALSAGATDVEESILLILRTAKGERVMRPEFGCGIHDYAFATVDTSTLSLVEASVEDALREWEPRIEVLAVDASTEKLEQGRLDVSIDYRIRQTNDERNLVYPFYVDGEGQ